MNAFFESASATRSTSDFRPAIVGLRREREGEKERFRRAQNFAARSRRRGGELWSQGRLQKRAEARATASQL